MRKIVIVLAAVFTCLLISPLFIYSEESNGTQILLDSSINNRSLDSLRKTLKKFQFTEDYVWVEEYTKSWIRKEIIQGDFDYATQLIYVILESNIDCNYEDEELIDLYIELISM